MENSLLNTLGYNPTLTVEQARGNRAFWAVQGELLPATRASIRVANIVLVPEGDSFRGSGPYFPEGTIELYEFLKSKTEGVEIGAEDDNFSEVARHSALSYLGELLVTAVVLPTIATLIAQYLGDRFLQPKGSAIRLGVAVERPDGSTGHITYEGLASDFTTHVVPLLEEMGLSCAPDAPPQLPPAGDSPTGAPTEEPLPNDAR